MFIIKAKIKPTLKNGNFYYITYRCKPYVTQFSKIQFCVFDLDSVPQILSFDEIESYTITE